jgi:hypothetical protein
VFVTGALADSYIEQILGLDSARETIMYAAGVGRPANAGPYRRDGIALNAFVPDGVDVRIPDPLPELPPMPDDPESLLRLAAPDHDD